MSRGRKPKSEVSDLNWQGFFNKNVGVYLQIIISHLGQSKNGGNESAIELLQQIENKKSVKGKKSLPEISCEEIPFAIPNNWVWCRLGEIIEFTDNRNIETEFSKDTLINYVDIDAIDNQTHVIRESKLKPVSDLSSRARRVLKKGYIMYSLVRPYLNNIAIVEEEKSNHIGSTGFAVFNGILVNNRYLKYILLSDYVRQLYLSMLSGFNSPTITQKQFNATPIPLPPISEQNKLLEYLSDFKNETIDKEKVYFNSEIENEILNIHKSQLIASQLSSELSNQLTELENLNQAILQEAVQGKLVAQDPTDEPAIELLKRIKAEKAKSVKKEKPLPPIKVEEIPFEIPESWVWCRLGQLFEIVRGSSPRPKGDPRYFSKERTSFHWITIADFAKHSELNLLKDTSQFLTEEGSKHSRKVTSSDLLVASSGVGSVGKSSELGITGFIYDGLMAIKNIPNQTMISYLAFYLKVKELEIYSIASGVNWLNINTDLLRNYLLPLPSLSEQKRIVAEIEKQLAKTKQLKEHIIANQQATKQLLKALLHQAFQPTETHVKEGEVEEIEVV